MGAKGNYIGIVNGEDVKIQIFRCFKKAEYSTGVRKYINVCDGQISYNNEKFENLWAVPLKSLKLKTFTKVDKL